MGIAVNAQEKENSEYVNSVKEMGRIITERSVSAFKQYDFLYRFTRDYQIEQKCVKLLHNTTNNIIKQRKSVQENREPKTKESDDLGIRKKMAFLDLLLKVKTDEGNFLSDKEIREEVDTFMFEGHDTTSSCISFVLYALSINPDCQRKVVDELNEIFEGDRDRMPTYRELQNMKYLEMVINESLRLYPSVPIFARNITEDIPFKNYILPKDLNVIIPVYAVHRDPKFFDDPDTFNPERFNFENKSKRKPFCFVPFSAGPRNCIGS